MSGNFLLFIFLTFLVFLYFFLAGLCRFFDSVFVLFTIHRRESSLLKVG
ncbi:hypothetical protein HMPREF1705_04760 [Acetomicrobium hydrogeniformans ATCC BAA-1850]|uniref:Uncharacterized protein n=1 Tax=Acetomicrobium hydrogeniformans ATCC BAA-1850 TaxID=592015 RepID=A0A0T5X9P8_9BACT|nr:hypothetical protein HMPREF1705_04760 [Acetomicrobium hydrogeniformans ATCC BAA-1850]